MAGNVWMRQLKKTAPKVHCLTNPVSVQEVANVLLAAGGSAIMGEDELEVQTITSLCQATLLNMGVLNDKKLCSCILAGKKANEINHPVVLDPVGAGVSLYRRKAVELVLEKVKMSVIRCNQEEACALLDLNRKPSGGVESSVSIPEGKQLKLAKMLAQLHNCTVLISGESDVVSDGERCTLVTGGDPKIRRITGGGCMLSALCALFCGAGLAPYEAACVAGNIWKESSRIAGKRTEKIHGGIGSFHVHLFDAVDRICHGRRKEHEI